MLNMLNKLLKFRLVNPEPCALLLPTLIFYYDVNVRFFYFILFHFTLCIYLVCKTLKKYKPTTEELLTGATGRLAAFQRCVFNKWGVQGNPRESEIAWSLTSLQIVSPLRFQVSFSPSANVKTAVSRITFCRTTASVWEEKVLDLNVNQKYEIMTDN